MSRHIAAAQESMMPSWDTARERRVLERAMNARARRSRAIRVFAWSSAAALALVLMRAAPLGLGLPWSAPSNAPSVQPLGPEPSTSNPPPSFTDGGDRGGEVG
jgi:hypothetical protein